MTPNEITTLVTIVLACLVAYLYCGRATSADLLNLHRQMTQALEATGRNGQYDFTPEYVSVLCAFYMVDASRRKERTTLEDFLNAFECNGYSDYTGGASPPPNVEEALWVRTRTDFRSERYTNIHHYVDLEKDEGKLAYMQYAIKDIQDVRDRDATFAMWVN